MISNFKTKENSIYTIIREKHDLINTAKTLGIPLNKNRSHSIAPDGGGENAFIIYEHDQRWFDFKLNIGGDVTDLVAYMKYNGDKREALRDLAPEEFHDELEAYFNDEKCAQDNIQDWHNGLVNKPDYEPSRKVMAYLTKRKINEHTITTQKLGRGAFGTGFSVVIPFLDEKGDKALYYTQRAISDNAEQRYKFAQKDNFLKPCPLGLNTLNRSKDTLWLCEGAFDYLSLFQENFAVLSCCGGGGHKRLLKYVQPYKLIHLAFDSDKAGTRYTQEFAEALFNMRINFDVVQFPDGMKDISDYYMAGGSLHELAANAIQGLKYLAKRFTPQANMTRSEERKLTNDVKTFLIGAIRSGLDTSDIALLANDLVANGLPQNFVDAVVKKAEKGETDQEITDKVCELHTLIFHEKTGFYEYSRKNGIWIKKTDTAVASFVDDYLRHSATSKKAFSVAKKISIAVNSDVPVELFNKQNLFVFRNGTFDTNKGELREHVPEDYSTILLDYDYDKNAKCEKWLTFINDVTNGDKGRADVLQEFGGYIFFPDCRFARILVLIGEGRNGKNVYVDTLRNVFGAENCTSIKASRLGEKFQVIQLKDSLLNISSENQGSLQGAEDTLKGLASGDSQTDSYKSKDLITFIPRTKLVLCMNKYPKTDDDSDGFLDRLLFVSFTQKFTDEPIGANQHKVNRNLLNDLKQERAGIFNWLYRGYQRLRDNRRFTVIEDQKTNIEQFRKEINDVYDFVDEKLHDFFDENGIGKRLLRRGVYQMYTAWCNECGIQRPKTRKKFIPAFREALSDKGIQPEEIRTSQNRFFDFRNVKIPE